MSRELVCDFIATEKTIYGVSRLCRLFGLTRTSLYTSANRAGGPTGSQAGGRLRHPGRPDCLDRAPADLRRPPVDRRGARPRLERQTSGPADAAGRDREHAPAPAQEVRPTPRLQATAPDRVERDFTAAAPNQLCVADIIYLRSEEAFVCLAVVVDAFSREVVSWAIADHLRTELVLDAVGMRSPPADRRRARCITPTAAASPVHLLLRQGAARLRTAGLDGPVGPAFDNAMPSPSSPR